MRSSISRVERNLSLAIATTLCGADKLATNYMIDPSHTFIQFRFLIWAMAFSLDASTILRALFLGTKKIQLARRSMSR